MEDLPNPFWSFFREVLQTAVISFAIFFIVYIFFVAPHRVRGQSMMPNFTDGELILTEKVSYYFREPARGDVIVFRSSAGKKVDFIKRIIGLPGESIKIEEGVVYIDNQELVESYETQETVGSVDLTLDKNQYFVLGDNRGSSSDSRSFGSISKQSIRGRAWLVYFPPQAIRFISSAHYGIPDSFDDR